MTRMHVISAAVGPLLAAIVNSPADVVGFAAFWLAIRGAAAGFFALARGRTTDEALKEAQLAGIATFPSAILLVVAGLLYLWLR